MTNADVARVFSNIAVMIEMDGGNPFRIRAYREAARIVGALAEPVSQLATTEGRLEGLAGIGKDLAQKIRDLALTGTTALYDELQARYPLEVVGLTELQGMGPKRVKTLFETLQVRDRGDLERAARDGKLRALPGFGPVLEQKILKALAVANEWTGRILLAGAWPVAHQIAEHVKRVPGVTLVELAGSFRRRKESIGDLDILVCGGSPDDVMEAFVGHGEVADVLGRGETKSSVRLSSGLQVDLRLVPEESWGAALVYFTGSKQHNIELRKIAIEKGLSLNEYGLTRAEKTVAGRTEEEVYRALDLDWVPPELREAMGEIALARQGKLPRLIEAGDIVADLHLHTDRTDGRDTLETMVRAARDRGYAYCAITDHSKALAMARGFDEARVQRSAEEIAAVRKQVPGIEVLHGLEVDILADGALDLADDALATLDWVIVSLHSRLDMPPEAMNERVLRALSHPAVHLFGHPTARMIGSREAAAFDLEQVLERAAERGVALEINAQPDRSDLSDAQARLARAKGVRLAISTDAHGTAQLDFMRYGVFAARRAGLTKDDVINALPLERMRADVKRAKSGAAGKSPAAEVGAAAGDAAPAETAAKTSPKRAARSKPESAEPDATPPAAKAPRARKPPKSGS